MKPLSILLCIFILPVFGQGTVCDSITQSVDYKTLKWQGNTNSTIATDSTWADTNEMQFDMKTSTEGTYTPPMTGGQSHSEFLTLELYNELLENSLTIDKLLTFYDQYKEACYNDSTLIEEIYIPSDMYPFATRTQWIYKQPTFTGFMEFIEEKQR